MVPPSEKPIYKDTWPKILGSLFCAHFIEAMGRSEGLFQLLLKDWYYKGLLSGFIIALLLWEIIGRITRWLDKHYDWMRNTGSRILLQVLLGVFGPAMLLYVLTFLQMRYLFHQSIQNTEYLLNEFPASLLLIILMNNYYLAYYFYFQASSSRVATKAQTHNQIIGEVEPESPLLQKKRILLVNKGAEQLPLPIEKIAFIYKSNDNAFIKTFDGSSFLTSYSLDELETLLSKEDFFRANRQVIVHWQACKSFSSLDYGKLELHLSEPYKEKVVVSQKKAPAFREWLLQHG